MKTLRYLYFSVLLLTLGLYSCTKQGGYPFPKPSTQKATLHLAIQSPRQATLRCITSETPDPLLTPHQLRLVFYSEGATPLVKEIREITVTSSTNLQDLPVALPEGAYQLVVIANPTSTLRERTEIGRPLSQLTTAQRFLLDALLNTKPQLSVTMLNAGDPIAISPSTFASSSSKVQVKIEPTLARVLLYGEPTLSLGATTGKAPAGYVIQPQAKQEVLLRPLGLLLSGGEETKGHRSEEADVYPKGPLFTAWEASKPTSLLEHLSYFPTEKLIAKEGQGYWASLAKDEQGLGALRGATGCYARETTLPASAYLTGAVPSLLIRYPYIPAGLTLSEGEGWISYQGKYYAEHQIKEELKSKTFTDEALGKALQQAGITTDSFTTPFEKQGIAFYQHGYSYYTFPIRHYEDSKAPQKSSPGRYGLVRGNAYRIHLTRILRPGHAAPTDLSTALDPLVEEKSLGATLEVRPLSIRSSEAHL